MRTWRLGFVVGTATTLATASASYGNATIGSLNASGASLSSGHAFFGQSFAVPVGETNLRSATLVAYNNSGGTLSPTLELWLYDNGSLLAPIGSASVSLPVGLTRSLTATFDAEVVPELTYAVLLRFAGPTGNAGGYSSGDYYPGGTTFYESQFAPVVFPNNDQAFQVVFAPIPEPTAVAGAVGLAMLTLRRTR